jgi:plasmid stability protein
MPPDATVQLSVRVPVELASALTALAARNDRTVSQELRRIIRAHVLPTQQPSNESA